MRDTSYDDFFCLEGVAVIGRSSSPYSFLEMSWELGVVRKKTSNGVHD